MHTELQGSGEPISFFQKYFFCICPICPASSNFCDVQQDTYQRQPPVAQIVESKQSIFYILYAPSMPRQPLRLANSSSVFSTLSSSSTPFLCQNVRALGRIEGTCEANIIIHTYESYEV